MLFLHLYVGGGKLVGVAQICRICDQILKGLMLLRTEEIVVKNFDLVINLCKSPLRSQAGIHSQILILNNVWWLTFQNSEASSLIVLVRASI